MGSSSITNKRDRRKRLLAYGVPESFLDEVDNPSCFESMDRFCIYPEGLYSIFEDISHYDSLAGYEITPIADHGWSDFYALVSSADRTGFVKFNVESFEGFSRYENSFERLLAHILILYYELEPLVLPHPLSVEELSRIAARLGLPRSNEFFSMLEAASVAGQNSERSTFEGDDRWRKTTFDLLGY